MAVAVVGDGVEEPDEHFALHLVENSVPAHKRLGTTTIGSDDTISMSVADASGTLNRLLADGLIIETTDRARREDKERRRYYRLTGETSRSLTANSHGCTPC